MSIKLESLPERYRLQVIATNQNANSSCRPISHSKPKRHQAPALGAAVSGEKESLPRALVVFTGYRVRPLDPDNFAGSVKDLLDGLRHARLVAGDEPWRIELVTRQVRVATMAEERTEIDIDT